MGHHMYLVIFGTSVWQRVIIIDAVFWGITKNVYFATKAPILTYIFERGITGKGASGSEHTAYAVFAA